MTATATDKRIDELEARGDLGFEQVDKRLQDLSKLVNHRCDRVEADIRELRSELRDLRSELETWRRDTLLSERRRI